MKQEPYAWVEKYWGSDVGEQYEFHTSNPTNNPNWIPLYTAPQTNLKPTLTKVDGKLVAVTMTDEEHRIHEVLWKAPQTKPLSDEEAIYILERMEYSSFEVETSYDYEMRIIRAIEERHGIK